MSAKANIAIIGAGLMGHGIALTFASAGHPVVVQDPFEEARASLKDRIQHSMTVIGQSEPEIAAALPLVSTVESIADCVAQADFVIEAAPENLELKQKLFAEIEQAAPAQAVLASNTSVIQISKIVADLQHKDRVVGTHWWNPPHMIPLVEVIKTAWSDAAGAQAMFDLLASVGKTPVMVEKDVPGFIGNRLQHALWREAISLVENGICDAEAVDTVIKSSFGRRLSVLGPLENADLVGTDLSLAIHNQVLFDIEARQGPSPLLEQKVKDGELGMKSGRGFYDWTPEQAQAVKDRVSEHLAKLETILPT